MNRIAIIDKEKCTGAACGYICMKVCPPNKQDIECVFIDPDDKKAGIIEETCIGCSICVHKCPFDAIKILNLPEQLSQDPVHQYSQNGFRLFNLPIPRFGKVVGVLGRNGIGKSTAIKILAGVLKPNLGKYDAQEQPDIQQLLEYYKGTEAQTFFEKMRDGEIKVALKPQSVDLIPQQATGSVGDLLTKVDERGIKEKLISELGLIEILDRDVATISGGELQRVAIAATVMKKANLYIFDEPTSYLDIQQRILVSNFIRNLADENTAVLVVEHDLIILDHMTDHIHLMYGNVGAYGIVTLPKTTREGINTYLSGFIKEQNMRFRDTEIKFFAIAHDDKRISEMRLTQWSGIKKSLGTFSLEAQEGHIAHQEVVGILGQNGIGKTSFVKVLAGVHNPDAGEVETKIKVAYKPQYLEKSDALVMDVLKDALKEENMLIRPLQIKPLLMKQLDQLSGGELQRVAICHCLSQDADLYLFDEPSAYLDVEQRLGVSRMIREFMMKKERSAMIVDHDMLFIDYISDRLVVFDGEPAKSGQAKGPFPMQEGMNNFLKSLNITMRRDEASHRPRINKLDSQMDQKQRNENQYYYL